MAGMRAAAQRYAALFLWVLAALLAVRFALFCLRAATHVSNGFASYYVAARLVAEGADVARFYDDQWFDAQVQAHGVPVREVFIPNVPTTALILLPLHTPGYAGARLIWTIGNLALLIGAVALLVRQTHMRGVWLPAVISFVLLFQPVYANFNQGQAYVLTFALLTLAWYGYHQQRPVLLGVVLGLLLTLKLAGVLLWLLLLVRRQWRAIAWGAGTALIVAIGSLPWLGLEAWRACASVLQHLSAQPWLSVTAYQSQPGFFRHLFTFDAQWNPAPLVHAPALGIWLAWAGFGAMIGVTAYCARASNRPPATSDGRSGPITHHDLALAAFTVAGIILNPLSADYHYTMLLLPIALVAAWCRDHARPLAGILLAGAVALMATDLPYHAPQLASGAWALLAYPKLYGAWLLWGLTVLQCGMRRPSTIT